MDSFTTRIELHGGSGEDYERLHGQMAKHGFKRTIPGVDDEGGEHTYRLPSAEYDSTSAGDAASVRKVAKQVADAIRPGAWVLVTKVAERAWHTAVVS